MYPGVELRLLRYVVVLAQELNFTRASARLRVAQPSLSRQIRQLEEYLGLTLFDRTKREVRLTAAGEAFAVEARQATLHAERAIEVARAACGQHRGPWTLGYSPLIDLRILPKIRQYLSGSHPGADLRFVSAHTSEQSSSLMSGTLQAGLVILPVQEEGLTCRGFHREALVVALPPHHRLAAKVEIELTDLDEVPLVTIRSDCEARFGECVNRAFRLARIGKRVLHQATTQSEALQLAAYQGLAALLMPSAQHFSHEGIVFRKLADHFLTAETALAYHAENTSAILRSLEAFLLETFLPLAHASPTERQNRQLRLFTADRAESALNAKVKTA
jgi:DNA-binding transcriptional LysR family regulator